MRHSRSVLASILIVLFLLSGCDFIDAERRSGDDDPAEPPHESPIQPDPSPTAGPTPSPTPEVEVVPPTPIPSGSFLLSDAIRIRQVILWDPELPAEYGTTQFLLYQRAEARSWRRVGTLPINAHIVADPGDPNILYLGDHPPCLREGEPIPFYRSEDGGRNWEQVPDVLNIRPILVWPDDSNVLIGSRCGLAISQDRGETWTTHLPDSGFDLTRLTVTEVGLFGLFTDEREINNLRRIQIEDLNEPVFESPLLTFWGPGSVSATRERIYVAESRGVHTSDDGGRTWTFSAQGLEDVVTSVNPMEESIPERDLEAGIGLNAILPHPTEVNRIFVGSIRGLYLSEDGGQNWGNVAEVEDRRVERLQFTMNGAVLYVTTPDGVIILHNP